MTVAAPARSANAEAAEGVHAYARAVVAGEIVTNRYVRLACQRHLDDMEHGHERGLVWDAEEAGRAIRFFDFLKLKDGRPFVLQPSQVFKTGSIFGWLLVGGGRRFRTVYDEEGKGGGKTPWAAGIGLKLMVADRKRGAEIYTAGVTRDQAKYLWNDGAAMVDASPYLKRLVDVMAQNMLYGRTGSFMRPLSSEARSLDQKRVHGALIDEIHEHATPLVVEKMRAGTKGDDWALIVEVTNSGYDRTSICWQHHQYSIQVLEGVIANDSWFAWVCGLDEGDDWMNDESCWVKANPLLEITPGRRYLREQVQEARDMPAHAALVARLNFCVWTEASAGAIDMAKWDQEANQRPAEIPDGAVVYAGLDLSSTTDIATLLLEWQDEAGDLHVEPHFWCPQAAIEIRTRRDHLPYDVWAKDGLIVATEGDVTDYASILADLKTISERVQIHEAGFIRLNATQFVTDAGAYTTMVPTSQSYVALSAATKDWLARIASGRVRHGGNPVLRWMAANLVVDSQAGTQDMKPSNERSTERITGQSAAIVALARLTAPHDPPPAEPGFLGYIRRRLADYSSPEEELEELVDGPAEHEDVPPEPVELALCGRLYRAAANAIDSCGRPAGHPGRCGPGA